MLRFDKMKIVVPDYVVSVINERSVNRTFNGDSLVGMKYEVKDPCNISVKVDYNHKETVVEFTGKILGDRYPELISRDTISACLQRINDMGAIKLDVEMVLLLGEVNKCDVTADIPFEEIEAFKRFANTNYANKFRYKSENRNNGLTICNSVTTARHKKRMAVYDKANELQMATNRSFLNSLNDKDALVSYFDGKVRFERNLTTKVSIRKALSIEDNRIETVLNADAEPIKDILYEAIKPAVNEFRPNCRKDIQCEAVLRMYDYDLAKVEAALRVVAKPHDRMSRIMQPYIEYMNRREMALTGSFDFNELLELLPY